MTVVSGIPQTEKRRRSQIISVHLFSDLLRVLDWAIIILVGLVIYWAYPEMPATIVPSMNYQMALLIGATVTVLSFSWLGAYQPGTVLRQGMPIGRAMVAWMGSAGLLLSIAFALKISEEFSRVWAVTWFALTPLAVFAMRAFVGARVRALAAQGKFALRTVIFGAGEYGQRLARHLREQSDPMIDVIGFVDDRRHRVPPICEGFDVLGNTDDLIEMVRSDAVDQVLVALPWGAKSRLKHLIESIGVTPVSILLAPDVAGFLPTGRSIISVAEVPMVQVLDAPFSGWGALLKAIEDRLLSGLFILLASPVLIACALAIRLDSKGPVIFKQRRFGYNNQEILVWKFRSMYTDRCDITGSQQATKDDPRVTRVGRLLRRTSLDELPQLFNVFRGEMSIVGPRPHAVSTKIGDRLFSELVHRYDARHKVKPGITGWAQVNGWRGETDTVEKIQKRVEYDLFYIENWSIWLDLYIIIKTVLLVFKDDKAY